MSAIWVVGGSVPCQVTTRQERHKKYKDQEVSESEDEIILGTHGTLP